MYCIAGKPLNNVIEGNRAIIMFLLRGQSFVGGLPFSFVCSIYDFSGEDDVF